METIKPKSKKISINLSALKGLGETIKKIDFHRVKLFDLTECAKLQYQQIVGESKINSKELVD